jgi:hypothetical protein
MLKAETPLRSHVLPWALALWALGLSGCAVGNVGTMAANVQRHETLSVMSVYSVGLHVRTRADDPGAHFGYSKRVYVFAADPSLAPGWHFLSVPSPAAGALALDLLTIGVDASLAAPEAGIALGHAHTRFYARLPSDGCMLLKYVGPDLRIDKFITCAEDM